MGCWSVGVVESCGPLPVPVSPGPPGRTCSGTIRTLPCGDLTGGWFGFMATRLYTQKTGKCTPICRRRRRRLLAAPELVLAAFAPAQVALDLPGRPPQQFFRRPTAGLGKSCQVEQSASEL